MSARYPFASQAPWFPHRVTVRRPDVRDAFGKVLTYITTPNVPARVTISPVEQLEGGMRTMRQGIAARLSINEIAGGDEVEFAGVVYSVYQISASPDHSGEFHTWTVWAVVKRGTN